MLCGNISISSRVRGHVSDEDGVPRGARRGLLRSAEVEEALGHLQGAEGEPLAGGRRLQEANLEISRKINQL